MAPKKIEGTRRATHGGRNVKNSRFPQSRIKKTCARLILV
jgi:hypothetical protein